MRAHNLKSEFNPLIKITIILIGLLSLLFARSFQPDYVHFSNDGPLGQQMIGYAQFPSSLLGFWGDSTVIGSSSGTWTVSLNTILFWTLGPVYFAKFAPALSLLILGLGAWTFFRALRLSPLAATMGAVAAILNSTFFASACWGVSTQAIALGMVFFAMALVMANTAETPPLTRWLRLALAGLCIGLNVMEAADLAALYSLLVAAFIFYKSFTEEQKKPAWKKIARGFSRVTIVAIFAGFIAFQTVLSLVGSYIQGVAGTAQDTETKAQHWDWATQWSLPKQETLGLIVPGLFGYKMDTPKDMMPSVAKFYEGGVYWGGVGRDPNLDRFYDSGSQGTPPSGFMRFTGGENYCGVLVILVALWAAAQSFRRQNSPFSNPERKLIWFWFFLALLCLPIAWGRFAPFSHTSNDFLFYAFLYKLPYFSTIRNPVKFLNFFAWATTILFAYGVHALHRSYLKDSAINNSGITDRLRRWWSQCSSFDRKWTMLVCGGFGVSLLAWLIYSSQKPELIQHLQQRGFPDQEFAQQIATFSIAQAGWFVGLLGVAIVLLLLTITGYFSGARAKIGAGLLGVFLLFDLVRADLPYIIHWDYKQKYEVGALNPIVDYLRNKPNEHRVAALPFNTPPGLELFNELYRIEWTQHLFLYYNIQCFDIIQMPRMATDLKSFYEAFAPRSNDQAPLITREWQLTNTRYLLGPAGFLDVLNQQLDPVQHRFQIVQRFGVALKPGVTEFHQKLEELTAYLKPDGDYALFEFTGALPRAKLYANWQVNTNDPANLKTLADANFDPAKTVLVSTPQANLPVMATNENSGTVEYASYSPKHIVLNADAATSSVLLLNDHYDPGWHVTVDGQPAPLLRCNFLMRGVYLSPGKHTVKFDFSLPNKPLYVTLTAFGVGVLLCGILLFTRRGSNPPN